MATAPTSPFSNLVSGKILHKESGAGLPNLVVELFDLDQWADPESSANATTPPGTIAAVAPIAAPAISDLYKVGDRVGSAITDAGGNFRLEISPQDFSPARAQERKPDLLLLVLAPDEPGMDLGKRLLHATRELYLNAASKEAYVIRLSTALLEERAIPYGAEVATPSVDERVKAYAERRRLERQFDAGVAGVHGAEAAVENQERAVLRTDLIRKLTTDLGAQRLHGAFVAEGGDVKTKHESILEKGLGNASALIAPTGQGVPTNLFFTPADVTDLLAPYLANPVDGFAEIPQAVVRKTRYGGTAGDDPASLLINHNPIASYCAAESASNKCADLHTGNGEDEHEHEEEEDDDDDDGDGEGEGGSNGDHELTEAHVRTYLDRLLRNVPAPDMVLHPELTAKRADKTAVEAAVNDFSLQKGPAEVPAFHDFHSLQIAFEHVWKQLFDEQIPTLTYTADTVGKNKFGTNGLVSDKIKNGFYAVNLAQIVMLLDVPAVVARFFDVTKEEYNELSFTMRQQLERIANDILERQPSIDVDYGLLKFTHLGSRLNDLRIVQSLTEQGDRLIDTVRHDEYYTLHRTLRDLNSRLSGKYEFTVFAADKNHHSVNFGIMNTYRQQWTPLMYQAGRLVKSVPLSPKEKLDYSTKVTTHEKRAEKEGKKNNSSFTSEQSSISRVEAEIMAKAQNKTTFGIQAEGEVNFAVYDGKVGSTFGVEAASESSQSRKDFRESVLKAVQDYKNETTLEVTTESDSSSETVQSGSIVNPNEELAVTYLFYELQKRYRLSEKLHRVTPVVLVAQEVPSPDQITPAWVLTHDWILNRCLLDDSFRPTLSYLANKSVGDDFSLRELRKNIRQQRNLVETLRIEFSAASVQADNRYRALESAITRRIDEEQAEDTDGFFNDVADFLGKGRGVTALFGLGGSGQSPEAMKARELAAKDAHQYALEKAEKASAALKEEINTLHAMTERYNKSLQERLDNETKVKRLLVHIRNNIFYYMQAIWRMEPPDQRYLRLHNVQVPVLDLSSRSYRVRVEPEDVDMFAAFREDGTRKHRAFLHGTLAHTPNGGFEWQPLAQIADLDNLLGFKGNYMIFPMKQHNGLTELMAAPYVDAAFGAMDPDELSNITLDEFSDYVCCLHKRLPKDQFDARRDGLRAWLDKLLASPLRNGDEIVVPTGSLFIESLVDPNPILEDFKLKHRELDVYKVQEEVRGAALENLRLAARLLNSEREDPTIEKKIVIEGAPGGVVVPPEA